MCRMPTIQYSSGSARLYLVSGSLGPPLSSTQTASRLLSPAVFVGLTRWQSDRPTDRPTDHATRSITIGGIYVRSTAMWSNNYCSISKLLDWFPCFYHRMEQGNRRQQTSFRPRCGIARLTIYFLNRPVNAKLPSLSYFHQYIFLSSATYTDAIVTSTA